MQLGLLACSLERCENSNHSQLQIPTSEENATHHELCLSGEHHQNETHQSVLLLKNLHQLQAEVLVNHIIAQLLLVLLHGLVIIIFIIIDVVLAISIFDILIIRFIRVIILRELQPHILPQTSVKRQKKNLNRGPHET